MDGVFISDWNLYNNTLEIFTKALKNNSWLTILMDPNNKSQSIPKSQISKLGFKNNTNVK